MAEIDVPGLEVAQAGGAQLLDVREPFEYAVAHVPGARPVPMGQLVDRVHELDRSRPVYLICASGNRSGAMCRVLAAAGIEAVNVAGGTTAWVRSGRPVERSLR